MNSRTLTPLRVLPSRAKPGDRADVEIFRPFFIAGILTVLTAGCLLGAFALLGVSMSRSYTASAWTPYVLAHANSQLYGWVGFFIMGFALQQHPPTIARARLYHQLAWLSLGLMGMGIALRFVAEPLVQVNRIPWIQVGILACFLQILALTAFAVNIAVTRFRSGTLGWQSKFVFAALFWLGVIAIAEPFSFAQSHQGSSVASVSFVANWFPILRDLQFLGFVAQMIFGVALVKLGSCFGARRANRTLGEWAFYLWNVGLMIRSLGWLNAHDKTFSGTSQAPYFIGGSLIAVAAVCAILSTRIFERLDSNLRSHKFVRGAFTWLVVAGFLIIIEPIHLREIGAPFSHAYSGAIRHALTVGFISQMILGFGLHVVSRMTDHEERMLPSLTTVFITLNLGNALRVGLEVATDHTPNAFMLIGVSGFIELIALVIWAGHMAAMLTGRIRNRHNA